MKKILDIGCGRNKHSIDKAEVIGVDIEPDAGVDVIHDLDTLPWPFEDSEFDEVICQDILEHLGDLNLIMQEINRVCKKGSMVKIRVPHYSSYYAYNNPGHKHYIGYFMFDYFCRKNFEIIKKEILFPRIWRILGLSSIINRYPERWEQLFAFMIRAENLYIELEVVKNDFNFQRDDDA